ncbi:MAG TPA: hypothetical protein VMF10_05370 [Candidatus Aquilonibacter sp.]|nr:hypothetical protein [Candidatus Aquilonibacter sp.]
MSEEFLSIAIWDPVPGMETASLATIRELSNIIARKKYGRDLLYRSGRSYVLLRYWRSTEAQTAALEDPEMLHCWARLGNEIQIVRVFEKLEEVGPAKSAM